MNIKAVLMDFFKANPHRSIHNQNITENESVINTLAKKLENPLNPATTLIKWATEINEKNTLCSINIINSVMNVSISIFDKNIKIVATIQKEIPLYANGEQINQIIKECENFILANQDLP